MARLERQSSNSRARQARLALLGRAELAASLKSLAEAARLGALPTDDETHSRIETACADIAAIRALLLKALGSKTP